jgi:hypothetical protein
MLAATVDSKAGRLKAGLRTSTSAFLREDQRCHRLTSVSSMSSVAQFPPLNPLASEFPAPAYLAIMVRSTASASHHAEAFSLPALCSALCRP